MPQSPPGLVPAGFVERLGIARSDARTGLRNIDLHVSNPRSPTSASIAGLHTQRVVQSVPATSPLDGGRPIAAAFVKHQKADRKPDPRAGAGNRALGHPRANTQTEDRE